MINEREYILKISQNLERFKELGDGKFNFKCPICSDGKTKYKTRAWFIERDSYLFHCFNCNTQMSLSNFLKEYFPDIYKEFIFDKLKNNSKNSNTLKFKEEKKIDYKTDRFLKNILKPSNEVSDYLNSRQIPENRFKDIYVIENFKDLNHIEKYKDSKFVKEKRVVLPCYNSDGLISGIVARSLDKNASKRYINLKFYDDPNLIFGLYDEKGNFKINLNKTIYVVEGAFDSFFIPNCVSVNTSDLLIFEKVIPENMKKHLNVVYVCDNECRNKEIIDVYKKIIKSGNKIVIFPKSIKEKDINEIILKHKDIDILEVLKENVYSGLKAEITLNTWKCI